jgi:hypothetical protein
MEPMIERLTTTPCVRAWEARVRARAAKCFELWSRDAARARCVATDEPDHLFHRVLQDRERSDGVRVYALLARSHSTAPFIVARAFVVPAIDAFTLTAGYAVTRFFADVFSEKRLASAVFTHLGKLDAACARERAESLRLAWCRDWEASS